MHFCKRHIILLVALFCTLGLRAQALSEQAQISLLSCGPGQEVYARYGHSAIRVFDPAYGIDWVFNYGLFDFNSDYFYWRFVKGETYYVLGAQETSYFMADYQHEHRCVYEQVLNLTPEQKQQIWEKLIWNIQPENRTYLYNFVFDNCATRPYQLIRQALSDSIRSNYTGYTGTTFRNAIRHYTDPNSWVSVGINLVFGPKADRPMTSDERLFLPEELMFYTSTAQLTDGTPLVANEQIRVFTPYRAPIYTAWWLHTAILVLLLFVLSLYDRKRGKLSLWADILIAVLYLLLLLIVAFLTFCSIHPLVGFGWRLLIIPALYVLGRFVYLIPKKK